MILSRRRLLGGAAATALFIKVDPAQAVMGWDDFLISLGLAVAANVSTQLILNTFHLNGGATSSDLNEILNNAIAELERYVAFQFVESRKSTAKALVDAGSTNLGQYKNSGVISHLDVANQNLSLAMAELRQVGVAAFTFHPAAATMTLAAIAEEYKKFQKPGIAQNYSDEVARADVMLLAWRDEIKRELDRKASLIYLGDSRRFELDEGELRATKAFTCWYEESGEHHHLDGLSKSKAESCVAERRSWLAGQRAVFEKNLASMYKLRAAWADGATNVMGRRTWGSQKPFADYTPFGVIAPQQISDTLSNTIYLPNH